MTESLARRRRAPADTARHPSNGPSSSSPGLDGAAVCRGASRGFAVLALGLLAQPALVKLTGLDQMVLLGTLVVASAVAAALTSPSSGILCGALAAGTSYLLGVPLLLLMGARPAAVALLIGAAMAVLVGAGAGRLATAAMTGKGHA